VRVIPSYSANQKVSRVIEKLNNGEDLPNVQRSFMVKYTSTKQRTI
jgi:hypothetical protein